MNVLKLGITGLILAGPIVGFPAIAEDPAAPTVTYRTIAPKGEFVLVKEFSMENVEVEGQSDKDKKNVAAKKRNAFLPSWPESYRCGCRD